MNEIIDNFKIIIKLRERSKNGNLTNLACGSEFGKTVKCGFGKMRIR